MTKLTQLRTHYNSLIEINTILLAIRNLSLMEVKKVSQFNAAQINMMKTLGIVRDDFLASYPSMPPTSKNPQTTLYILIGSQRGFCGNFNKNISLQLKKELEKNINKKENKKEESNKEEAPLVILIGQKLASYFDTEDPILKTIQGPSVTEDIQTCILFLTHFLEENSTLEKMTRPKNWCLIYNELNGNECFTRALRPFEHFYKKPCTASVIKPLLYLNKETFLSQFLEYYLFSLLNHVFYQSFLAENDYRVHHLTGAVSRLEKKSEHLKNSISLFRQEEMIEEIEVILLNN